MIATNKESLIKRYPMLGNPGLWVVTASAIFVAIGWIIANKPWISYVDTFPFNRNWVQNGSGVVVKQEGPFRYRDIPIHYVVHFTYSYSDEKYTSQCIFYAPLSEAYKAGDSVPLLIYKNNPCIVKINGSDVVLMRAPFLGAFVLLIATPIVFIVFVRSFPAPRKKGKRKKKRKIIKSSGSFKS